MEIRRRDHLFLAVFGLLVLAPDQSTWAQCSSLKDPGSTVVGSAIHFLAGPGVTSDLIDGAIGMWSSGCPAGPGNHFPSLQNGGSGGASYTVSLGGVNTAGAECGSFSGGSITLY